MIKGCIRKNILKDLPYKAPVQLIAKFSKHRYEIVRFGVKIKDLSCKKMLVAFGHTKKKVSYFNLTCSDIEKVIEVMSVMTDRKKGNDELPF